MRVAVQLIQQPNVDFAGFLGLMHEALGRNLSAPSDAAKRDVNSAERFLSCLQSMVDPQAGVELYPHLFGHVSFSVLIGTDERDMLDVLQVASGLHFVVADTKARGIQVAIVTGTLAQWRDAVVAGTLLGGATQQVYCQVCNLFVGVGLDVWRDFNRRGSGGQVFLLEHRK